MISNSSAQLTGFVLGVYLNADTPFRLHFFERLSLGVDHIWLETLEVTPHWILCNTTVPSFFIHHLFFIFTLSLFLYLSFSLSLPFSSRDSHSKLVCFLANFTSIFCILTHFLSQSHSRWCTVTRARSRHRREERPPHPVQQAVDRRYFTLTLPV